MPFQPLLESFLCILEIDILISEAILITGGDGARQSAELFLPWQNKTCELPSLPDRRKFHVQSGSLFCGGGDYSATKKNCLKWSAQQGGWVMLPLKLTAGRAASRVWSLSQDNSLVIMGGGYGAALETSETFSSDGDSTSITFNMKYRTL